MALFKTLSRYFIRYEPCQPCEPVCLTLPDTQASGCCWIFGNHHVTDQHVVGTPNLGYCIFLKSIDGFSYLAARIGDTEIVDTEMIIDREWFHAGFIWDGDVLTLYKNGEPIAIKAVDKISYGQHFFDTCVWAFADSEGGNSVHLGINYFTIWEVALTPEMMKMMSVPETSDVQQFFPDEIVIGDFLDSPGFEGKYGDTCININTGVISLPHSPFPNGNVPFLVPDVHISSSSSSDSTSSTSTSSTSSTSTSSTSSTSTSSSDSTSSTSTSSTSSTSSESTSSSSSESTLSSSSSNTAAKNIALVFNDESSPYENNNTWNTDRVDYENNYAQLMTTIAFAIGSDAGTIAGIPLSADIDIHDTSRPPPLSEFISGYSASIPDLNSVVNVTYLIDTSGSMRRSTIEPAIDQFTTWLNTNYPLVSVAEVSMGERWLREVIDNTSLITRP